MSILAYILHLLMGEPLKTQRCLRKTIGVVNIEPVVAFLPSSIHFYLLSPLWTRMMKNEGYKKCLTEKCKKDLPLKWRVLLHIISLLARLLLNQFSAIVVFFFMHFNHLWRCGLLLFFFPEKGTLSLLHWCFNLGFPKSWNWKTLLIWELTAWMTINCDKFSPLGYPHPWP